MRKNHRQDRAGPPAIECGNIPYWFRHRSLPLHTLYVTVVAGPSQELIPLDCSTHHNRNFRFQLYLYAKTIPLPPSRVKFSSTSPPSGCIAARFDRFGDSSGLFLASNLPHC